MLQEGRLRADPLYFIHLCTAKIKDVLLAFHFVHFHHLGGNSSVLVSCHYFFRAQITTRLGKDLLVIV